MNNDLERFSEERLKELSNINGDINTRFCDADIEALARIALAAKQAKPEYHIVRLELNDAWGSETVLNAYESQHDASKCKDDHGGVIIPCYTTPQPAHTEQGEMPDKALSLSETIGELRKYIDSSGGYNFESLRSEQVNSPAIPDGWLAIPSTPSQAHLNSIAMRYRHDFYLLNEAQKQSALATARQMYEECSGQGYFNIAAPKPESE